jgi:hypothetical protein
MATQSQYNRFAQLLVTLAILVGMTIFICGVGIGALVMWVAPDVGTGTRQAFIDHAVPEKAHAGSHSSWSNHPIVG